MVEGDPLDSVVGFDWDGANVEKNWLGHRVAFWEAEDVFFNAPLVIEKDLRHSTIEQPSFALGHNDAGRLLFVCFTIRNDLIRVISARDMTRRERRVYEHHEA